MKSFESRFETLEKKLEEMSSKVENMKSVAEPDNVDKVRDAIKAELQEERELENRKYNVLLHSVPEPTGDSVDIRNRSDYDSADTILNATLSCNVELFDIQRLGRQFNGRNKPRPIRFTVRNFEDKRRVLDSARMLRNHEQFSHVYITPDLTKGQRVAAFNLREEKRQRERNGERGLVIRKGRITQNTQNRPESDHSYTPPNGPESDHSYTPGQGNAPAASQAGSGNNSFR